MLCGTFVLVYVVGFLPATALYVLGTLLLNRQRTWLSVSLTAAVVVSMVLLSTFLKVSLPGAFWEAN